MRNGGWHPVRFGTLKTYHLSDDEKSFLKEPFLNGKYRPYRFHDKENDMHGDLIDVLQSIYPLAQRKYPYFNETQADFEQSTTDEKVAKGRYAAWLEKVAQGYLQWWNQFKNMTKFNPYDSQWSNASIFLPYDGNAVDNMIVDPFLLKDGKDRNTFITNKLQWQPKHFIINLFAHKYGYPNIGGSSVNYPPVPPDAVGYQNAINFLVSLSNVKLNGNDWIPTTLYQSALWGDHGSLHMNLPPGFERLFPNTQTDHYGFLQEFPLPIMLTDPWFVGPIPSTRSMEAPSKEIRNYWKKLISQFQTNGNHRLILPWAAGFTFPNTDRIGFKGYGTPNPSEKQNLTTHMELIDQSYDKETLQSFHSYIEKNCATLFHHCGLFQTSFGNVKTDVWRNAIYQCIHLRLAERHFFAPWSLYKNPPDEPSVFPSVENIQNELINTGIRQIDWGVAIWADNVFNKNQDHDTQRPPNHPYGPSPSEPVKKPLRQWINGALATDTIYFDVAHNILLAIDKQVKSKSSVFTVDQDNLDLFGKWIFHYRLDTDGGFDYFGNDFHYKYWPKVMKIDPFDSYHTWQDCMEYHLNDFYQFITTKLSVPTLKQTGFPDIDPSDLEGGSNGPPGTPAWSGNYTPTENEQEIQVLKWFEDQWTATKDYQGWPVITIDLAAGTYSVVITGTESPWNKFWNSFKDFFTPEPPKADWFNEHPPDDNIVVIDSFFLPPFSKFSQRIKKMYWYMKTLSLPPLISDKDMDGKKWEARRKAQWGAYVDFIYKNMEYEDAITAYNLKHPDTPQRGIGLNAPLRTLDGKTVMVPNPDKNKTDMIALTNSIPDYGLFYRDDSKQNFNWIWNIYNWLHIAEEFLEEIIDIVTRLGEIIINSLGDLIGELLGKASDVIFGNLPILLLGLAGAYVGYQVYMGNKK
jgi:hypothetical protein